MELNQLRSVKVASIFSPCQSKQAGVDSEERTRPGLAPKTQSTTTHPWAQMHTNNLSSTWYWPDRSHSNCPSGVCAISLSSGSKAERLRRHELHTVIGKMTHSALIREGKMTNPHRHKHTHNLQSCNNWSMMWRDQSGYKLYVQRGITDRFTLCIHQFYF